MCIDTLHIYNYLDQTTYLGTDQPQRLQDIVGPRRFTPSRYAAMSLVDGIHWGTSTGYRRCYSEPPSNLGSQMQVETVVNQSTRSSLQYLTHPAFPPRSVQFVENLNDYGRQKLMISPMAFGGYHTMCHRLEVVLGNDLPLPGFSVSRIDLTYDFPVSFEEIRSRLRIKNFRKRVTYDSSADEESIAYGSVSTGKFVKCYNKAKELGLRTPLTRFEVSYQSGKKIKAEIFNGEEPRLYGLEAALMRLITDERQLKRVFGYYELCPQPEFLITPDTYRGQALTDEMYELIRQSGELDGLYQTAGYTRLRRHCHPRGTPTNRYRRLVRFPPNDSIQQPKDGFRLELARFMGAA